jgi:hypothetical protein
LRVTTGRAALRHADFPVWLAGRIDDAIEDLLCQDRLALESGTVPLDSEDSPYAFLERVLGLQRTASLRCAVAFNGLPESTRRTFFALFLEGRTIDECLESGLGPVEELRRRAQVAVDTITGRRGSES